MSIHILWLEDLPHDEAANTSKAVRILARFVPTAYEEECVGNKEGTRMREEEEEERLLEHSGPLGMEQACVCWFTQMRGTV